MCGLAGIVFRRGGESAQGALDAMVRAQIHRGPDDGGTALLAFGRGRLGLGHRRLSIRDLSTAGHQPMIRLDTGDHLIFNGELYNAADLRKELEARGIRFRGHSDTEILLHALSEWGTDALPRLAGMYAFAHYDARAGRLLLARDPLGIKPLYVARTADGLAFASEVRALLASELVEPSVDRRGLAGMLAYGAVQHPLTLFEGIESFPPGSFQIVEPERESAPEPFWSWPAPAAGGAAEDIQDTLATAVRDHLVADVPVGVFLSSGLDSTLVAGLAGRAGGRLRSFTVGFADQPDLSEFVAAAETAAVFGLDHTEISVTGPAAREAAVAWLDALDQPSIDGLNTYLIARAVRSEGISVALSGLGGDELFGGYPSFADVPRLHRRLGHVLPLPAPLCRAAGGLASALRSEAAGEKLRDLLATDGSLTSLYLQRRRLLSDGFLRELGLEAAALELDANFLPAESYLGLALPKGSPVAAVSQLESRFYQGNTLLRDSDANSMAHGLELRVPLLDLRLVERVATLPDGVRLPGGRPNKPLLRELFTPLLRQELLSRRKMGFTLPIRRWMAGPLREPCEDALACLKATGLLRPEGVDRVWRAFLSAPETPVWSRAWALVVLGSYLDRLPQGGAGSA